MKKVLVILLFLSLPALASRQFRTASDTLLGPSAALPANGTLSFWVNPQFASGDGVYHILFEQYNQTTGAYFQLLTGGVGSANGALYTAWNSGSAAAVAIAAAGSYQLHQNAWNHIVVTWVNGGSLSLYLNGSQIATALYCPWIGLTGTRQSIGNRSTGGSDSRSQMAQVGIWSRVLANWEISLLAAGNFPGSFPTSLFEEYDLSGSSLTAQAGIGGALGTSGPIAAGDPPPPTPPALSLAGPTNGITGTASAFFNLGATNLVKTVVVTPSDGGNGGSFAPASLTLTGPQPAAVFTYTAALPGVVNFSFSNDQNIANPAPYSFTAAVPIPAPTLTADSTSKTVARGADATYVLTQAALGGYTGGTPDLQVFNVPSSFALTVNGQDCGVTGNAVAYSNWRTCGASSTGTYTLTVHTAGLAPGVYYFTVICAQPQAPNGFGVSLTLTVQ